MVNLGKLIKDMDIENLEPGYIRTHTHEEIRNWAEKHDGKPQWFDDPEAGADIPGIRIDFPGKADEKYMQEAVKFKDISWETFFKLFETVKYDFIYKENPAPSEDLSLCYMFVFRKED